MNLTEMHVWFRQYAQQMGMQNVRAILPEQIDILINTSINDVVNELIRTNIGITNDRVITDNSKIGQINSLRSLYKVTEIDMSPDIAFTKENRTFVFNAADRFSGKMTTNFKKISNNTNIPDYLFLVDFALNYKAVDKGNGYTGKNLITTKLSYNIQTPVSAFSPTKDYKFDEWIYENETVKLECAFGSEIILAELKLNASKTELVYVEDESYKLIAEMVTGSFNYRITNFSIDSTPNEGEYKNPVETRPKQYSEYKQPEFSEEGFVTNYFPVRLIDDAYLADTLNDFILKNRLRSPILTIYNKDVFDLYIDTFKQVVGSNGDKRYVLDSNLVPYKFRMSYLAKPATVKYNEDKGQPNVDCDLPEHMHVDILKHAVDLYRLAVTGSLSAAQQQEQNQQREDMRNNYRNDGRQQQVQQ